MLSFGPTAKIGDSALIESEPGANAAIGVSALIVSELPSGVTATIGVSALIVSELPSGVTATIGVSALIVSEPACGDAATIGVCALIVSEPVCGATGVTVLTPVAVLTAPPESVVELAATFSDADDASVGVAPSPAAPHPATRLPMSINAAAVACARRGLSSITFLVPVPPEFASMIMVVSLPPDPFR
jgi:hypothetical protein